jgi:hypothetical protein
MCSSRTHQQSNAAPVAWDESAGPTQINSIAAAANSQKTLLTAQIPLPFCLPTTQRHAARRSAGCCFIHSASCGAPIKQDCIETSAKSEVGDGLFVAVCRRGKTAEHGDGLDHDRRVPPLRWALSPLTA